MIALCYGVPGAGKSTLLHDLVRQPGHRYFICEHSDEWLPESPLWRGKPPALTVYTKEEGHPDEFPEEGIFVFVGYEGNEVAELAVQEGNTVYVDDEIDLIARRQGWQESPLREIIHRGRHAPNKNGEICELHLLAACRRPQNLATDLTDLADQFYLFRVQGSRTLRRLQDDSLLDSDSEWEVIRTLPNFHFKHWPSNQFLSIPGLGAK